MSKLKKFELFTVPQNERVEVLKRIVIVWMDNLTSGEQLVVGLPQVLGKWNECTPLVVGPGMQEQFLAWLEDNASYVEGPVYLLPALNSGFLCAVIDEKFDPRTENLDDPTDELKGVLVTLGNLMTLRESQT